MPTHTPHCLTLISARAHIDPTDKRPLTAPFVRRSHTAFGIGDNVLVAHTKNHCNSKSEDIFVGGIDAIYAPPCSCVPCCGASSLHSTLTPLNPTHPLTRFLFSAIICPTLH